MVSSDTIVKVTHERSRGRMQSCLAGRKVDVVLLGSLQCSEWYPSCVFVGVCEWMTVKMRVAEE